MLDMGFLPDIRRILAQLPSRRQTLFFSATMPGPIAALAGEMLRNPVSIATQRQSAPAIGHHAGRLSGRAGAQVLAARAPAERQDDDPGAGVHANQASRQPPCRCAGAGRHQVRAHPRQPVAGAAHRCARRLQERHLSGPRRDRYRRARHRRRPAWATSSTSTCRWCPTTTSTVSAAPAAPKPPATRSRSSPRTRRTSLRDIERAIGRRLPQGDGSRLRLHRTAEDQARDSARPAHRGDSRAQARRARTGRGQCGAAGGCHPPAEAAGRSTAPATAGRGTSSVCRTSPAAFGRTSGALLRRPSSASWLGPATPRSIACPAPARRPRTGQRTRLNDQKS